MPVPVQLFELSYALTEAPTQYMPSKPSQFAVKYIVISPKGSRARFSRTTSLTHILGAQSETAVQFYLKSVHPGCDILIQALSFL